MRRGSLKLIVRRIIKERTLSNINILGLSLGIVSVVLLASWVIYETSYDKYLPDGKSIYRVNLEGDLNGVHMTSSSCMAGVAPEAKKIFPEVLDYVRLVGGYKDLVIKKESNKSIRESGYAADSTFFNMFQ